jgi:hypothetical protein
MVTAVPAVVSNMVCGRCAEDVRRAFEIAGKLTIEEIEGLRYAHAKESYRSFHRQMIWAVALIAAGFLSIGLIHVVTILTIVLSTGGVSIGCLIGIAAFSISDRSPSLDLAIELKRYEASRRNNRDT